MHIMPNELPATISAINRVFDVVELIFVRLILLGSCVLGAHKLFFGTFNLGSHKRPVNGGAADAEKGSDGVRGLALLNQLPGVRYLLRRVSGSRVAFISVSPIACSSVKRMKR